MTLQVFDLKDCSPAWASAHLFEAYLYASCRRNIIPLRLSPATVILPW